MTKRVAVGAVLFALGVAPIYGQGAAPAADVVIHTDHGPNAPEQEKKHYVVLVSLDGFRWDYAKTHHAKNLLAMAADGASAPEGMLPSYPSITFPNHYTLVTGLYPEHHGIVAMSFYNAQHTEQYHYYSTASDGTWYGGTPLWSLAEKQGMRAACFFWPGSEAEIAGTRPSYYLHFDDKYPEEKRIDQVLEWLHLPEEERPHFITLYYSNVDHAGHEFGPDAPETATAIAKVDGLIGQLRQGLAATHLPVDLVVVSDHGMTHEPQEWITLDKWADLSHFKTSGFLLYPDSEADAAEAYSKLKSADPRFEVYRRADVPKELHYNSNDRIGDPVIVPVAPVAIRAHAPMDGKPDKPAIPGTHGLDPRRFPEMKAIFYAEGPDIAHGVKLKPFENVNVYPFLANILKLDAPPVDGSASVLDRALRGSH